MADSQDSKQNKAVADAIDAAVKAGNRCTQCTCTGFQSDPNDPAICIAPRPPQGRCQHSVLYHP